MKTFFTVFFTLLVFSTSIFAQRKTEIEIRRNTYNEWISAMEKTVVNIKDPEVKMIFEFFKRNVVLGFKDTRGNVLVEDHASTETSFLLLPTFESEKVLGKDQYGRFDQEVRGIYISIDSKVNSTIKAIILLHEAYHTYLFMEKDMKVENSAEFTQHEMLAYNFQNKILKELGGKKYQKFLDEEVKKTLQLKNKGINQIYVMQQYNNKLNNILSFPVKYEEEKNFLAGMVSKDIFFTFIERHLPKEYIEKEKRALMYEMHKTEIMSHM